MNANDIKRNIPSFPLTTLLLALIVPATFTVWLLMSSHENIKTAMLLHQNTSTVTSIKDRIKYLDEVLTMSANMLVHSGNKIWLERYNQNSLLMDKALLTAIDLGTAEDGKKQKVAIFDINQQLVSIERNAFQFALSGQLTTAQQSLNTPNYNKYKQTLSSNLTMITNGVGEKLNLLELELKRNKQAHYTMSIVGLAASIIVIIYLGVTIQRWRNMLITTAQYMYQQELSEKRRLDQKVQLRTEELSLANKLLQSNLHQLKLTQDELIEAEKLSSISLLVTGVAHEVNTPLGIGITSNTFLKDNLLKLTEKYNTDSLSKKDIEQFIQQSKEGIDLVEQNLERSAQLIVNFKKVSSDQFIKDKQTLSLSGYINKVIFTLSSLIKRSNVTIDIIEKDQRMLTTYPGSWAQIITNLIENAIKHGFKNREEGNKITITVYNDDKFHYLSFKDNGHGIDKKNQNKIFEAFFTTNRSNGGTGLVLFVVNNILKQQLKGKISCSSSILQGTEFLIKVPSLVENVS